ncbi:HDOD domain-containing protein [Stenotrophomonas acidaminiphila]
MSPELTAALSLCRNLPSPPGIAIRIIELAQDPETDIATAADAIAMDVALSARMMRIANSPLYASRRRIENLGQALTMLGLNATLQLALGFSLAHALDREGQDPRLLERIWRRSVLCALAARFLGLGCGVRRVEELMLAGLLQDIGALALMQASPDIYPALFDSATCNAELLAHERAILGCSHADAGAQLCEQWHLPRYLVDAIARSEPPAEPADLFQRCVALSGCVAEVWLAADADAARSHALQQAYQELGMDSPAFELVLQRVSQMLPELCALLDVPVPSSARLRFLLDHANELKELRNLRELQDASATRRRADDFELMARRLAEQAHLDALTGVLNRRHLETVLEQEFARAAHMNRPLSIAFIDLDDFKKINDAHGHLAGDQVLQSFASHLQEQLRNSDTVARFGGEEFVVLFPDTDERIALEVVRRVLDTIARTPMAEIEGAPLHVTFSAGVATHGHYERFANVQDLLKAADDVLYRSKSLGRNRVIARAPEPQPAPG